MDCGTFRSIGDDFMLGEVDESQYQAFADQLGLSEEQVSKAISKDQECQQEQ